MFACKNNLLEPINNLVFGSEKKNLIKNNFVFAIALLVYRVENLNFVQKLVAPPKNIKNNGLEKIVFALEKMRDTKNKFV
jgi:hypothetical protein